MSIQLIHSQGNVRSFLEVLTGTQLVGASKNNSWFEPVASPRPLSSRPTSLGRSSERISWWTRPSSRDPSTCRICPSRYKVWGSCRDQTPSDLENNWEKSAVMNAHILNRIGSACLPPERFGPAVELHLTIILSFASDEERTFETSAIYFSHGVPSPSLTFSVSPHMPTHSTQVSPSQTDATLLDHVAACWAGLAKRTQHCSSWWPNACNMLGPGKTRTHCGGHLVSHDVARPWQNVATLLRAEQTQERFEDFREHYFVSRKQNLCPPQMLRAWQNESTLRKHDYVSNVAATMCPRFPGPLRWCYTGQLAKPTCNADSQRMFFARICRHVTLLNRFQKLPTRCSTANIVKNRSQRAVTIEWFFAQHHIIASWRCKLSSVTPPLRATMSHDVAPTCCMRLAKFLAL